MSKKDEALKLELQRIRSIVGQVTGLDDEDEDNLRDAYKSIDRVIDSLAEQPAQQQEPVEWLTGCPECGMDGGCDCDSGTWNPPAQQEPVAWMHPDGRIWTFGRGLDKSTFTVPLYTSPPANKPWVGLTDEERNAIGRHHAYVDNIIRATEAKLREKNA